MKNNSEHHRQPTNRKTDNYPQKIHGRTHTHHHRTENSNLLWEERYVQTTADQAQEEHPGHQTTDLYHPYIVK